MSQERAYLLRKLVEYEPQAINLMQQIQPQESKYKKRKNSDTTNSETSSINKPLNKKQRIVQQPSFLKKQPMAQQQSPVQQHTVQVLPKLPINIDGQFTLLSLGRIVFDRPAYHANTIYPAGYKISRMFNNQMFICRILENGEYPLFIIYSAGNPQQKYTGTTSDDAHTELLQAFESRLIMPDGNNFFGLTNKRIIDYINLLPNAKRLIKQKLMKRENFLIDDNARSLHIGITNVPDKLF